MDARIHQHRMTRWLGKLFVVLSLAASWEVQAAPEQVPPLSSPVYSNIGCTTWWPYATCQASAAVDACNIYLMSPWGAPSEPPNYPAPVFDRLVQENDPHWYMCNYDYYINGGDHMTDNALSEITVTVTCPTPKVHPEISYVFNPASGMCERDVPVAKCPVTALAHPPFSDACSTSLEAGKGKDVNNKCGKLRDDMDKAASCIADKIKALSSPRIDYSGSSATIRTAVYQDHLLEIWTKSQQLNCLMNSLSYSPEYLAEMREACAKRKAEIDAEKQAHGIKHRPSSSGEAAPHVERRAIDVPEAVSDALMDQVTVYSTTITKVNGKNKTTTVIVSDVEDYIHSATINPPACDSNISWGGRFDSDDWVHFQLP